MAFLRQLNLMVWSVTEAIFGALKQYNGGHDAKLILWEVQGSFISHYLH